jgi:hypothetical protein
MSAIVRVIAIFLGLSAAAGPFSMFLLFVGLEPTNPLPWKVVALFFLGGLALTFGYVIVAIDANRLASSTMEIRLLAACLMAIPCAAAAYLLPVTGSLVVASLALAILIGTVILISACVWPAWLARITSSSRVTDEGRL